MSHYLLCCRFILLYFCLCVCVCTCSINCQTLDTGFPCVDRSPLNGYSKHNVNCVQLGIGKTGQGFKMVAAAEAQHQPEITQLEYVKGLDQQIPDKDGNLMDSDATWIVKKFKADGAWCDCVFNDAAEHGSAVEREMLHWGIIRNLRS